MGCIFSNYNKSTPEQQNNNSSSSRSRRIATAKDQQRGLLQSIWIRTPGRESDADSENQPDDDRRMRAMNEGGAGKLEELDDANDNNGILMTMNELSVSKQQQRFIKQQSTDNSNSHRSPLASSSGVTAAGKPSFLAKLMEFGRKHTIRQSVKVDACKYPNCHTQVNTDYDNRGFQRKQQKSQEGNSRSGGDEVEGSRGHQWSPVLLPGTNSQLIGSLQVPADDRTHRQSSLSSGTSSSSGGYRSLVAGLGASGGIKRKKQSQSLESVSKMHAAADLTRLINRNEQATSVSNQPVDESRKSSRLVTSNSVDASENKHMDGHHQEANETDVSLFTSVQQLCYRIINETILLKKLNSSSMRRRYDSSQGEQLPKAGKVLCLFLFGCQGSSKGEIAFELVEHSALLRALNRSGDRNDSEYLEDIERTDCPLYHHFDVAAIIVANIDTRIREYNQLVNQATRTKREQVALSKQKKLSENERDQNKENQNEAAEQEEEEEGEYGDQGIEDASEDDEDLTTNQGKYHDRSNTSRDPSISDVSSATDIALDTNKHQQRQHATDDFGLITLSTKRRSILQLKLIKYFNSITSKWIASLIQAEVDRLETLIGWKQNAHLATRHRVYLINMVPNQLSLFKSCLYLQQNIHLKEFKYPFWALKFERRTNIKLSTKERTLAERNNNQSSNNNKADGRSSPNKSALRIIKLPMLGSRTPEPPTLPAKRNGGSADGDTSGHLNALASTVIAYGVNEKLGPKFNANFAQQFEHINRLTQVRYNPTRDYNYANNDEDNDELRHDCSTKKPLKQRSCSSKLKSSSSTCYQPGSNTRCFKQDDTRCCWSSCETGIDDKDGTITGPSGLTSTKMMTMNDRTISASMQNLLTPSDGASGASDNSPSQPSTPQPGRLSISSTSGGALNQQQQQQQLLPQSNSLGAVSTPSLIGSSVDGGETSAAESDLSSASGLHRVPSWRSSAIKCAIELELYDSSKHCPQLAQVVAGRQSVNNLHSSDSTSTTKTNALGNSAPREPATNLPIYYQEATSKKSTTRARSPLMGFASHHKRHHSAHYQLVQVRVAYANDQSQVMLEVKRVHQRQIKLKSSTDLGRLVKLIAKSRRQLVDDCEGWLYDELIKQPPSFAIASPAAQMDHHRVQHHHSPVISTSGGHVVRRRIGSAGLVSGSGQHSAAAAAATVAELIVYTIRVDINRIVAGQFQYPTQFESWRKMRFQSTEFERQQVANADANKCSLASSRKPEATCPVPILTLNSSNSGINQARSASAAEVEQQLHHLNQQQQQRPVSSRSVKSGSTTNQQRPKRHVQFKLSPAPVPESTSIRTPEDSSGSEQQLESLQVQRRKWLGDSVFVSADIECCSGLNGKLLELVAALVSFSISPPQSVG